MKSQKLSILLVFLLLTIATSADTKASSSQVQLDTICGKWLVVQVYVGAFTFPAKAILPDGAANPYIVYGGPDLVAENYYCIYDPVIELISPPDRTPDGYSISQKITGWSTIEPAGGQLPSAEFDAWPQSGSAPLRVSMHIVLTDNISSCLWEYGDGTTGTSCDAYHDHVYTSGGSYTVKLTVTGPSGSNTMTRSSYIAVTAATVCYTLTKGVNPSNTGSIIAFPIPNCADGKYAAGTQLSLVATPLSGYQFTSWSGSLSGNANPATLLMDADKSVTATFSQSSFCNAVTEIPQTECEALITFYNSTNGAGWSNNDNWLDTTSPCSWFGVVCNNNHVVQLVLPNNQLNGALPQQLSALTNLQVLSLYVNQLSGPIPPALGSLANLISMSLSDNQLSGSIPTSFGSLSNLQLLHAHGNQFIGNIPTQLGSLTNLLELDLASNQLSGNIPVQLGSLLKLEKLGLGSNQLSGNIPSEIGKLTKLVGINLSNNQLSGNLPTQIGDLVNLDFLSIENNSLSGALPSSLTNLNKLVHFWFNNTSLCEPGDSAFQSWLTKISDLNHTSVICPIASPTPTQTNPPTKTPSPAATLTPISTPIMTPTGANPVIFIPGIMGSRLKLQEGNITNPSTDSTLWPSLWRPSQGKMSLKNGGDLRIYTDYAFDRYCLDPWCLVATLVYEPLITKMASKYPEYRTEGYPVFRISCDTTQYGSKLFVFPWDFRKGVNAENINLLKSYISCASLLNANQDVNIVAHSMGGLLAQAYIVANPTTHKVKKLISIGTPWLGAPKTTLALLTGELDDLTNKLISQWYIRGLTEHFPGAHELLPSRTYFEHALLAPFTISRLDNAGTTRLPQETVTYDVFGARIKELYRSPWESEGYRTNEPIIANNQRLYSNAEIYDWSINHGVEYHVIYGKHWLQTIGGIQAVEHNVCLEGGDTPVTTCRRLWLYTPIKVEGDGTVPLISARKSGSNFDYSANAEFHLFTDNPSSSVNAPADHLGLTQNTKVQSCILNILSGAGCSTSQVEATNNTINEYQLKYINLWGLSSLYISDGIKTTQNLITSTLDLNAVSGVAVNYMGDNAVTITFLASRSYTITFESEGVIFAEVIEGTNNIDPIQRTVYTHIAVPMGNLVQLKSSQPLSVTLTQDTDRDGIVESIILPTQEYTNSVIFLPLITR